MVKRYTAQIVVRLTPENLAVLNAKCNELRIERSVYARKAIEICLRKGLIK